MAAMPFWPAEWAPQDGILLAWPHRGTDWAGNLDYVEACFGQLLAAICRRQRAVVCVADGDVEARMRRVAGNAGAESSRLRSVTVDYDDTWLRDSGPVTVLSDRGPVLLDFRFTGWGGKFQSSRDDCLVQALFAQQLFSTRSQHRRIDFVLEGGAIETDGAGTLLSTWHCLTTRHPGRSRDEIQRILTESLAVDRFLWLERGSLEGDDTDAHIDTLARFAPGDSIVYQSCDVRDDPHHDELLAMAEELRGFRTADGRRYQLHALPWPREIYGDDGRRLAASYANFLIINGAVLMPGYDDPADAAAASILATAFPGRSIEIVPCRPLIEQNGSLHCLTMQLPKGVLADD
jgi:agmatine/peptidylarginine deiminase